MNRIAWITATMMVALVLVVAGCGDGDSGAPADDSGKAADTGSSGPVKFETGKEFKGVFIPKQTGIAVFDQANDGAKAAAGELGVDAAQYLGPSSPDACVNGQIDT